MNLPGLQKIVQTISFTITTTHVVVPDSGALHLAVHIMADALANLIPRMKLTNVNER